MRGKSFTGSTALLLVILLAATLPMLQCSKRGFLPESVSWDQPPEPIGGFAAIQKNLKYPEKAFENKTEGTVIVKALIDKRGKVKATRIVKSLSPECDKAAVKALKKSRWRPALKNGKPVTASVSIPIVFKLKK